MKDEGEGLRGIEGSLLNLTLGQAQNEGEEGEGWGGGVEEQ